MVTEISIIHRITWNNSNNSNNFSFTYDTEGIYFALAAVTDDHQNQYSEQLVINVLSVDYLNSILVSKWSGMVGALIDKDIEAALSYFTESSRPKYEIGFNILIDQLPDIFSLPG
jgi:hypothetical protein